jgi:hypothetical protein
MTVNAGREYGMVKPGNGIDRVDIIEAALASANSG